MSQGIEFTNIKGSINDKPGPADIENYRPYIKHLSKENK